jgi:U6 snRNA-associated Sm-like protein LSm7
MNLVLDEVEEIMRGEFSSGIITMMKLTSDTDPKDLNILTENKRQLGLIVVRGPLLLTIAPLDGMQEIENPFLQN